VTLVDTHCHLDVLADPDAGIAEAVAAGVGRFICMGLDAGSTAGVLELTQRHPQVLAGAGHHPTASAPPDLGALRELAAAAKVVAIGEVGLDFGHPEAAPPEDQIAWLHALCELSLETGLPLSIHNRGAEAELLEVLRAHRGVTGVMHYWALDWDWAERFLAAGLHLSFSGLATRPSREPGREVARRVPADRLLLETDAPFGTPHRRESPNRPAWLLDTAALVAELRGLSVTELAELEERNATALFTRLR
jgi:TatD DNase family protein